MMTPRLLIGVLAAAAVGLGAALLFEPIDERFDIGHGAPQAAQHALFAFQVDPSWVKAGTPNFRMMPAWRSPDGRTETGVWACDGPSTFEWHYVLDETVYLLDGQVEVEYQGRRFTLNPGDTAFFGAGTQALWKVPTMVRKVYALHKPNKAGRLWRRLFPATAGG
jgi:uncharacterized protein